MLPTVEELTDFFTRLKDPENGRDLSDKQVQDITIADETVAVKIGLTTYTTMLHGDFIENLREAYAKRFPDASAKEDSLKVEIVEHQRTHSALGQVGLRCKSVIAVGSGKGGVGKSTVATSLALTLKNAGCKVGLLDADVYGPSVPHLLGASGSPEVVDEKIQPIDYNGMPVLSIGFMVPVDEAVIWRGPMLHSCVTRFLRDTNWGELDFLIIDMPPGTGDVALTLSQLLPLTGAVVVCTPQEVALIDAIKAVSMFQKVKIPLLGIVENMSSFICPDNGKRYDIFGKGGAREYAEQAKLPFLGEIPINIQMRERGDAGQTLLNLEDPAIEPFLTKIAYQLCRSMADRAISKPAKPSLPVLG